MRMMRIARGNTKSTTLAARIYKHILAYYCFKNRLRHWFIAPFGRLRKPRPVIWDKYWEGTDFPICPRCGEMPHSLKACYFCGQRFTKEENENV